MELLNNPFSLRNYEKDRGRNGWWEKLIENDS